MHRLLKRLIVIFFIPFFAFSQKSIEADLKELQKTIAPDKRTAIFEYKISGDSVFVKTDQSSFRQNIELISEANAKVLKLQVLPFDTMAEDSLAVINLSVANIRSSPGQSEELATQVLLGTPIRVFEKVGGWYRVQTPDRYIGYLEGSSFVFKKASDLMPKHPLVVTVPFGFSKSSIAKKSPTVSDLTWGNLFELKRLKGKFYEVKYPDGRIAYIAKSDAIPLEQLRFEGVFPEGDQLVNSASGMKGIPYLWGGTSWKGVDCSGFTRTVFLMNGVYLPRDASQQALIGEKVDFKNDFSSFQKGDLLFFGKVVDGINKVTHVAMSLGGARFIHSSGMVRYGSLDPKDEYYDEFNSNRLLLVKRLKNTLESTYFLNNKTLY